jgi:hypothetical protein
MFSQYSRAIMAPLASRVFRLWWLINFSTPYFRRSQWPRGLRRKSTAARPLRLLVRIPPGHGWLSVVSIVLSGRGLCDGLITRPEESYRMWRVVVCDQETSNEEAQARDGAVENITKRAVKPKKTPHFQYSFLTHIFKSRNFWHENVKFLQNETPIYVFLLKKLGFYNIF